MLSQSIGAPLEEYRLPRVAPRSFPPKNKKYGLLKKKSSQQAHRLSLYPNYKQRTTMACSCCMACTYCEQCCDTSAHSTAVTFQVNTVVGLFWIMLKISTWLVVFFVPSKKPLLPCVPLFTICIAFPKTVYAIYCIYLIATL